MQIADLFSQMNSAQGMSQDINPKTGKLGQKGVEQLTQTLRQLTAGNIFEGTISSVNGSKVTIGLSNGQNLTARLDAGISLLEGQSMFFEVKSNEGGTVAIRPLSVNVSNNPTLIGALDTAGLPVTEKNLNMVNSMMRENMPIDSESLLEMARLTSNATSSDVSSAVIMNKYGIEATAENINQFENYKADEGQILKDMEAIVKELPKAILNSSADPKVVANFNKQIVSVLTGESGQDVNSLAQSMLDASSSENALENTAQKVAENGAQNAAETVASAEGKQEQVVQNNESIILNQGEETMPSKATVSDSQSADVKGLVSTQKEMVEVPIKDTVSEKSISAFEDVLKSIPSAKEGLKDIFTAGKLNENASTKDIVEAITKFTSETPELSEKAVKDILGSKVYRSALEDVVKQNWTLEPKEVMEKDSVKELFSRILEQSAQLENIAKSMGEAGKGLENSAKDAKDNTNFMNQLNQMYTYVQLPLSMSSGKTNSDLYVFSNKKNRGAIEDDGTVSAFLHFDMKHLGSTDISVKLKNKDVSCQWYLENETSLNIIAQNIDILTNRLQAKGYNCEINLSSDADAGKVDFVEDFIKQGSVTPTSSVHRYTFDARA